MCTVAGQRARDADLRDTASPASRASSLPQGIYFATWIPCGSELARDGVSPDTTNKTASQSGGRFAFSRPAFLAPLPLPGHPPARIPHHPVGAGLPAKAVDQSTNGLAEDTPSLAIQLLHRGWRQPGHCKKNGLPQWRPSCMLTAGFACAASIGGSPTSANTSLPGSRPVPRVPARLPPSPIETVATRSRFRR